MANEGANIVEEGIALRASDVDIVYLNGYGFPNWRGGPMFHADAVGLDKVLTAMHGWANGYGGQHWQPAKLLEKLVAKGGKLTSS